MILFDFTDYPHLLDVFCFLLSSMLFLGYLAFIKIMVARNPAYTVQGITTLARTAWVRNVMEEGKDILAVQTLRNSTMAATFLASTAILLTVGVLTLTGQGEKMRLTWQALNFMGSTHQSMLAVKLIILLLDLFAAFFFFSSSVRLYNHVGYMINAPYNKREKVMSPGIVAATLNRAGHHYSLGMRGFYSMVPLVFWIFGPIMLLLMTIVMLLILFRLDRTPKALEEDYHAHCEVGHCDIK